MNVKWVHIKQVSNEERRLRTGWSYAACGFSSILELCLTFGVFCTLSLSSSIIYLLLAPTLPSIPPPNPLMCLTPLLSFTFLSGTLFSYHPNCKDIPEDEAQYWTSKLERINTMRIHDEVSLQRIVFPADELWNVNLLVRLKILIVRPSNRTFFFIYFVLNIGSSLCEVVELYESGILQAEPNNLRVDYKCIYNIIHPSVLKVNLILK